MKIARRDGEYGNGICIPYPLRLATDGGGSGSPSRSEGKDSATMPPSHIGADRAATSAKL